MKKEKIQIKRSEVVYYAVTVVKDKEYGRCGTCKHYQQAVTCGVCYNGSRYSFDWRSYYNLHKEEILIQK